VPTPVRLPAAAGTLAAMMIDQASAWDRLLARHASRATRERLLASRFYQVLSRQFAGTTEYLAIDEIAELAGGGDLDLLVLDTPPGPRAIELLEAPGRARSLLDPRVLRWIPVRRTGLLGRELERATGGAALAELGGFLAAAAELADVLGERARCARAALTAPSTGVVLVTTPDDRAIAAVQSLAGAAGRLGLHVAGAVINRVHPQWPGPVAARDLEGALGTAGLQRDAAWLADNFVAHERRARGEARRIQALTSMLPPGLPTRSIPAFDADVHDLGALAQMAAALTARPSV
jgi:anion-transporting  ArsA/GET3 family ATPase